MQLKFSFVITTKNRLEDLKFTLDSLKSYLIRNDVELLICDDASKDGTQLFLKKNFSKHTLVFNEKSKGLIYNRNILNNLAKGTYIISIDDDLNFLTNDVLYKIDNYFKNYDNVALLSFRIYWNKKKPNKLHSNEASYRVKSYAGGAHVIRKSIWDKIPNYPSWFLFYGEEDFISYHLFKIKQEIHYFPEVLTHHRVDLHARKNNKDYRLRLRRSLRSGWYLFLLFYPLKKVPRIFLYTVYIQFKKKIFKGDLKALFAIFQALFDVFYNLPRLLKNANRLSDKEFLIYNELPETKLYWNPNEKN